MDELRAALELATEDELRDLTEILFGRGLNPLDYVAVPQALEVEQWERDRWLAALEDRFRFLAADGVTVLSRRTDEVTYRQVLVQVCRYLKVAYRPSDSVVHLESEIFLHLLGHALKKLPKAERRKFRVKLQKSLTQSQLLPKLPDHLQHDPLRLFVKGGSVLAVSAVLRPLLLQQIAKQFTLHLAAYQAARQAAAVGGAAIANRFQQQLAMQAARRGMTVATARYTAVRGVFAFLGPALWAWFFADLGWRAVATNYSRIIPIIYALAQIRLTRSPDCAVA